MEAGSPLAKWLMDTFKKTVESSTVGRNWHNVFYARTASPDAIFQQLMALKVKKDLRVLGDGLTEADFVTHFNRVLDLVNANPWAHGCLEKVVWDTKTLMFNNGVELVYG